MGSVRGGAVPPLPDLGGAPVCAAGVGMVAVVVVGVSRCPRLRSLSRVCRGPVCPPARDALQNGRAHR